MANTLVHEIELYPLDTFKSLLDYEIKKSRRYGTHLSFIHLAVETDASGPDAQHGAEIFAINALNVQLRDTDIPCRMGNEFLVFMPSTDEQGGRIVCKRLEKLFYKEAQIYDKVSFKLAAYIGLAAYPGSRSLTGQKLMSDASQALQHARENQITNTVVFSDLK